MVDGSPPEWILGSVVILSTSKGERIEGEVFAYDKQTNLVALKQPGSEPERHTLQFIKTASIKDVEVVRRPVGGGPAPALPTLNVAALQSAAGKRLQAAKLRAEKIGIGVSPEGQRLFDALAKTMECRWCGKDIVCMDAVIIKAPWHVDNVTAIAKGDHGASNRVREMIHLVVQVQDERKRWSQQGS